MSDVVIEPCWGVFDSCDTFLSLCASVFDGRCVSYRSKVTGYHKILYVSILRGIFLYAWDTKCTGTESNSESIHPPEITVSLFLSSFFCRRGRAAFEIYIR